MQDLIQAPFQQTSLLWQLIPIWLLWIVMETYFGTHKHEKLGWNSALANGVSLFWIVVSALQHIFSQNNEHFTWLKLVLVGVIAIYSLFIVYISFVHKISKKITFFISAPTVIYYFSSVVLLFAYDVIVLDNITLTAIVILFIAFLLLKTTYKSLLPEYGSDEEESEPFDKSLSSADSFNFDDMASSTLPDSSTTLSNPSSSPDPFQESPTNTASSQIQQDTHI